MSSHRSLTLKRSSLDCVIQQNVNGAIYGVHEQLTSSSGGGTSAFAYEFTSQKTYSRLAWNPGRDDNDVGAGQGLLETFIRRKVTHDLGWSCNVGQVGSDTRRVHNIIEAQLSYCQIHIRSIAQKANLRDVGVSLEEERQRLANAA